MINIGLGEDLTILEFAHTVCRGGRLSWQNHLRPIKTGWHTSKARRCFTAYSAGLESESFSERSSCQSVRRFPHESHAREVTIRQSCLLSLVPTSSGGTELAAFKVNSIPASSKARLRALTVELCAAKMPGVASRRLTVGSDMPDARAKSPWLQRNSARAARISSLVIDRESSSFGTTINPNSIFYCTIGIDTLAPGQ